ncbi:glycosyltransferase family 2 protein [Winogradskyella poriferorum]|uniref:glycosyltransferase family 2 protein n=1 Tax=Winogradskyella poriferorum TaxID=307627 RepID=UPI003D6515B6
MTKNGLNKRIFTVIVSYNGLLWIEDSINSVIGDTTVIVVDNLSTDGTRDLIKSKFPSVLLLEQEKNHGFGKANNIGIGYAFENNAEYILLLNQDAKMQKGSIEELFYASHEHEEFGILSPIHCDWEGEFLESSFSGYMSYEKNKFFYSDFVLSKEKQKIYEVTFFAAACWFMSKKAVLNVGGFDPIFKHLGEDVNLAQRFRYHGYKLGVLPNCKVMHDTMNRKYDKIDKFSDQYFYKLDYRSKMKFADLNISNWQEKLNYAKNQVKKEALLSLLKFRLTDLKGYLKELKELSRIELECAKSRELNRRTGDHYLN